MNDNLPTRNRDMKIFCHITMNTNINSSLFVIFFLLFLAFFSFIADLDDKYILKLQEGILLFNMLYSFLIVKRIYGSVVNINTLFLFLFFVFIGFRPVFDLLGLEDILYFDFFINGYVDVVVINRVLLNINIAILSYIGGLLCYNLYKPRREYAITTLKVHLPERFFWYFIFVGGVIRFYFAIQMYFAIKANGYLALFTGDLDVQRGNIFLNFLAGLYDVGLYFLIFSKKSVDKKVLILAFIYMILSFSSGQRGPGMLLFLFVFFIYIYQNRIRVNVLKLAFVFVAFVGLLSFVGWLRSEQSYNFEFSIFKFLWGQGISMIVLTEAIRWDNLIDYGITDLFGYIKYICEYYYYKFSYFDFPYTKLEIPIHYKFYSGYISNISNPVMYDWGNGIGGSYLAECYSIGKEYFQVFGGLLVSFLLNFMFDILKSSRGFWKFYAFHALPFLLYIPRDNLMDFIAQDWWYLISYFIAIFIMRMIFLFRKSYDNR